MDSQPAQQTRLPAPKKASLMREDMQGAIVKMDEHSNTM
jgi:hypothetical protein